MFNGKKHAICVTVPRCASTSAKEMMIDNDLGYVYKGEIIEGKIMIVSPLMYVSKEILDNAYVFAVVRNPYDRALSAAKHIGNRKRPFATLGNPPKWPSGLTWPYDNGTNRQRRTVSSYNHLVVTAKRLMTVDEETRCDHFVRVESYVDDMTALLKSFGMKAPDKFPHRRSTKRGEHPWTPNERRLVHNIYEEDFGFLGYEMIT